ncbi:hypothetical protein KQI41_12045 [Tissierella pigra]|uniref:hypothetical protein n=1 Tax=Tissierella pigra TaxID=2607614 RepID=UPI001C11A09A|nr:hypothetical protein [Tissierella pigra]MBU5427147.1 hypothetical protein [Tissierella pigra]
MSNGLITRQELGQELKEEIDKINVLTALPTTTGVANAYSVTIAGLLNLIPGLKVTVKFHQASNGASTLNINEFGAINIIKPGGRSPNLKAGGIYSLVHDGVNFQLQGEGGEYGTALASDVLTGKTIGTEDGIISGTMPNRGAVNITPSQADQTIVNGFHNGAGKVLKVPVPVANVLTGTTIAGAAGTMPNRGAPAQTITTQGGQYNIPAGYYSGGSVKAQFANLVAGNIKKGVNIGGVAGNYEQGMQLKRFTGSATLRGGSKGTTTTIVTGIQSDSVFVILEDYSSGVQRRTTYFIQKGSKVTLMDNQYGKRWIEFTSGGTLRFYSEDHMSDQDWGTSDDVRVYFEGCYSALV